MISSPAFKTGERIPDKFTCRGENISPMLVFSGVPANAKGIAMVMDDPDAPMGTFVHWVVWNIPGTVKEVAEGVRNIGVDGVGTSGRPGYHGPCPPPGHGPHRYFFKAYALDALLELKPGSDKTALEEAMEGHVLAKAELMGLYER